MKFNGCTIIFAKNDPEPEPSTGSLESLGNIFG